MNKNMNPSNNKVVYNNQNQNQDQDQNPNSKHETGENPVINKVIVKIHGQEYTLKSEDSREYMQGIAQFVDGRMTEIGGGNRKLSATMVAVLSALNIADDYFKLKTEYDVLMARQENPLVDVAHSKKKLEAFEVELEKRNDEYEHILEQFENLIESSSIYEEELDSLKQKLNVLSHELHAKERQLNQSGDQIKRLEFEVDHLKGRKDAIELSDAND